MSAAKEFTATSRMRAGKGAARAERRQGRVPAVIYGGNQPPVPISLDYKQVDLSIRAGHFLSTVFTIDVDGTAVRVLPRDYQLDVVRDTPLHVDFLRVTEGSRVRVEVPVHFKNQDQAPGLKVGGVINVIFHAIEVSCPPDQIPAEILVDLAGKEIGDSVHISEIVLPEGVTATDRTDFTVASIAPPSKEEAAAGPAPAAEGEAS